MFPDLTRDDVFRIETRRLWLRWPRAADAEAIIRLAGERAVAEMTASIPHPIDPQGIERFLFKARSRNAEGSALTMAVALLPKPTHLVGIVSIEPDPAASGPHLGYWLGRPHWGRGLMREAAQAMIDAYFGYAGGRELTSDVLVENAASRRVLESCGFAHAGACVKTFPLRGGDRTVDDFRLDRTTWAARARDTLHSALGARE